MITNITSILGHGFMSYKDKFELPIYSYEGKTVQIDGKNLDDEGSKSNGSGKSTLLEAISWGLYGKLSRKNRLKEEIINKDSKEGEIILTFIQDEKPYSIVRTLSRKKTTALKIYGSKEDELFYGATYEKKQEELEKILGMNFTAFQCSVMFGRDFMNFPDLKPAERAKILSDIRNLDKYMASSKKSAEKAKSMGYTVQDLLNKIGIIEGKIETLRQLSFQKDIDRFEEEKKKIISELEIGLQKLKKTRGRIYGEIQKGIADIEKEIESIGEKRDDILTRLSGENDTRKKYNELQERFAYLKADLLQINKDRVRIEKEINDMKEFGEGECPFCHQMVTEKHINAFLLAKIDDLGKLAKEEKRTKTNMEEVEILMGNAATKLQVLEAAKKEKQTLENEISNLKMKKVRIESDKEYTRILSEVEHVKKQIKDKESEVNPYLEQQEKRKKELLVLGRELRELKMAYDEEIENKKYYDFWVDGFKKIRMSLFEGMVEEIESLAQMYLSRYSSELNIKITTERETQSGTIKDEITIIIVDAKGREMSYEMYSGGEKQKVRLSISRALAQFISDSCGIDFNFIAFDEPNDALDDAGKESNFETFEELAELGKAVLVTDHDANFKDKFETNIVIIKENGESRINHG